MPNLSEDVFYDKERVKQLVHAGLSQDIKAQAHRCHRKPTGRLSRAAMAAAIFFLCAGSATAAAVHFEWDDALRTFLHPTAKQSEQLMPAGAEVNQSITDNGVTVTIRQVLGDKYSVYILGDIQAPEGTVLDDNFSFDTNHLRIESDDEPYSLGYGFDIIAAENRPTDNTLSFIYDLTASQALINSTAHLHLADLRYYDIEAGDYQTLVSGNWDFSWPMTYTDISQTDGVEHNAAAILGDGNKITEITFSPLSLSLIVQGPLAAKADNADNAPDEEALAEGQDITIVEDMASDAEDFDPAAVLLEQMAFIQADGSEIPIPWHTMGSSTENGEKLLITYHFGNILDTENITGLRIGEQIHHF